MLILGRTVQEAHISPDTVIYLLSSLGFQLYTHVRKQFLGMEIQSRCLRH